MRMGLGILAGFLALILVSSLAGAEAVQESTFASLGMGTIQVEGANQITCQDLNVTIPNGVQN